MKTRVLLLLVGLCLGAGLLYGGTTGKITGRVTDAESGAPLPGVNLVLSGTRIGAATDANGYYVILNVPPGTYSLEASMIGYAKVTMTNVVVNVDLTTTVDFRLKVEVLTMEQVVVEAERPIVPKDVSASQVNVESRVIASLPVQELSQVVGLQAGIRGLVIRGGDARQAAVLMDGLSLNDERSNTPYTTVPLSAVKEVQIQTGGFNAEYGNLRSGVINVITKEADRRRYSGTISAVYRPAGPKHFGPSIYDPNTYFTRPYLDPAVCWTGTAAGGWDSYTQRQYPSFPGWIAVADATLQDDDPSNDLTPEGAQRLWKWQHRRQGDITKPDYVVDFSFGGPVPWLSEVAGGLRFFLSHQRLREMFVFPLSRDAYGENVSQLKLITDIGPSMKLVLSGMYGEVHSVSPYDWTTTPTGSVLRGTYSVADLVNSSSGNAILYTPGYYSPASIYRNMVGAKFTHVLSPRTFYELSLQNNINRYNTFQMPLRNTSKRYEPVPGIWVDEAPWGYWGYGVTGIGDAMIIGGWMNLGRDKSVIQTSSLRFDLTSQVDTRNQVKGGFQLVYNDLNIKSYTENPGMSTWNRTQTYHRFPYRVGAYVQDKLEFQGFIANVGLRLDYTDPNGIRYALQPYDKLYREGYGKTIETAAPVEDAKAHLYLSPRLGVSHPITENSKLYFNYGHFLQEAASTYRFRLQREANGLVTSIGNPNLEEERTVAYELGYSQNLFDMFLLNIAAYYRDITNQPGWVYYQNITGSVKYNITENNNYQDVRGFEVTLTKRAGGWVSGFVNYTYEVITSGYFGLLRYYQDPNMQRDYLRQNPYQERPHPQPYARANIDFLTPPQFGPKVWGIHPLGMWNLNVLASWRAGAYETYNPHNIPGLVDNVQWKDYYNLDLRLAKTFRISRYDIQFYVDVTNALNLKRLSYAGFANYYDYLDYLESLHFPWETGAEQGNDRIGEYREEGVKYEPYDPTDPTKTKEDLDRILKTKAYIDMPNLTYFTFLDPRDVKFGIKVNF
ncbi:MAG: TonB-dependent receptor [Candidatus Oleimicrobiaceae bacterium]